MQISGNKGWLPKLLKKQEEIKQLLFILINMYLMENISGILLLNLFLFQSLQVHICNHYKVYTNTRVALLRDKTGQKLLQISNEQEYIYAVGLFLMMYFNIMHLKMYSLR